MKAPRVRAIVIAAGGTGGHFFPAEALAGALARRGERVVLLTDARSGAAKSDVFAGGEVHVIAGAGIAGRSFAKALAGAWAIARGVVAARRVMAAVAPAVVVGFGGYPAVAPVLGARLLRGRPRVILHDQNAVLGKANRFLARFADEVAVSFKGTAGVPAERTVVVTGNPVRPAIVAVAGSVFVEPGEKISVFVLGGSLGARVFATLIPGALALLPEGLRGRILLTMQCPAGDMETARAALAACGVAAVLAPFFADVAGLMAGAHLVVARAGGSTVAELAVVGRPAVLIPLQINDDQMANARMLEKAGGAVVVGQVEGAAALAGVLERLLVAPGSLAVMARAAAAVGIVDAAEALADVVQGALVGAA